MRLLAHLPTRTRLCDGTVRRTSQQGALKECIRFVVLVQPSLFDDYRRRVVVPLARRTTLPAHTGTAGSRMHPVLKSTALPLCCTFCTWFRSPCTSRERS